jgi:hypothetical protein
MPITPSIPRAPAEDTRVRRALDLLSAELNAVLSAQEIILESDGTFSVNQLTAARVFASRLFGPGPRYGQYGG